MATQYNKKNLGKPLEDFVSNTNKLYRKVGRAMIDKQHTECKPIRNSRGQVVSARYYDKATVDYIGRTKESGIAFDCKACNDDKISLSRLEDHQKNYLEDWQKIRGGVSFILVSFKMVDFYVIPWDAWKLATLVSENKELKKSKCEWRGFQPSGLKHIKKEDLPHEWKVCPSITQWGEFAHDYLSTIENILNREDNNGVSNERNSN